MPTMRIIVAFLIFLAPAPASADPAGVDGSTPVKIGWIGPISGPNVKWGSYQAVLLAQEQLNTAGQKPKLELIFEDGKGNGKDAAGAAQKLLHADGVKFILGGHCSPESLAIAPIVERGSSLMIASVTSNPFLTAAGDHVFRLTAVSTAGTEAVFKFAAAKGLKSFAVIYEESDYPRPQAEKFRELAEAGKFELKLYDGLAAGETDFKHVLIKLKQNLPEGLYIATISPDAAMLLMRQIRELHISIPIFGNENTGYAVNHSAADKSHFEGMVFAASKTGDAEPKVKAFKERYLKKYGVDELPYGYYTPEAYDSLMLLAETIRRCGTEVEAVKNCLYQIKDYEGASGHFSIDANGDAIREYQILKITAGKAEPVAAN